MRLTTAAIVLCSVGGFVSGLAGRLGIIEFIFGCLCGASVVWAVEADIRAHR